MHRASRPPGSGSINSLTGTIYTPSAHVNLSGNGSMTISGELIADSIELHGNGDVNINWSLGNTVQPIISSLVE